METVTTTVPSLTRQYKDEGELDTSHGRPRIEMSEDVQSRFRETFVKSWNVGKWDGQQSWNRLCELVADELARLPDNEFVRKDAWLCGLLPEMPAYIRQSLEKIERNRQEERIEQEPKTGWTKVRDMTQFEAVAVQYLHAMPPLDSGIRQ